MNASTLCLIVALILFLLDAIAVPVPRLRLTPLGLFFVVLAMLIGPIALRT